MKIDDALTFILVDMPSCPAPLASQNLLLAAREFCRESRCWKQELDPIPLVSGTRDYDLMPDNNQAQVFLVERVECPGMPPLVVLDSTQNRSVDWLTATGQPQRVRVSEDMQTLQLYPLPSGEALAALHVTVRLIPKLTATLLPDSILERHIEALAQGAKARLMAMSNRPWSDPAGSSMNRALFAAAMTDPAVATRQGGVTGSVFVTPPRFR